MEQSLHDKTEILKKITEVTQEIELLRDNLPDYETDRYKLLSRRVEKLRNQIKRIDEYIEEINALIKVAEANLDSKNIISIEAPEDYKVNINRLRGWVKMIDKSAINDVYAQRVEIVGKCDVCFLTKKKEEFNKQIISLEEEMKGEICTKTELIYNSVSNVIDLLKTITNGEDIQNEIENNNDVVLEEDSQPEGIESESKTEENDKKPVYYSESDTEVESVQEDKEAVNNEE